jgi:hypothetical protein
MIFYYCGEIGGLIRILFFFQLSLDLSYTDDEIYELSLAREPRNSSSVSSNKLRSTCIENTPILGCVVWI